MQSTVLRCGQSVDCLVCMYGSGVSPVISSGCH